MKPRTVFFIGKPGCGKGTQTKLLAKRTGWRSISAGVMFRTIAEEDTAVGGKIKAEIDAGDLAPHWFAMYLYLKSLFSIGQQEHVIFDGFNRKIEEARLVIDSLTWLERSCAIIYIAISDDTVRSRLVGRKEIEGRADDNAVEERLKEYREYTEPAIDLFRQADAFIEVDGEQAPDKIAEEIYTALSV